MKGFLIFLVLVVGGSLYFLAHTAEIGRDAIVAVEKEEGPLDQAFTDQIYKDPAAFAVKYKPLLERRAKIAKWLSILGESALVLDLGRTSQARYDESPLATDPNYGILLYRRAMASDEEIGPAQALESYEACRRYITLFPQGQYTDECQKMFNRLQFKYNFK